MSIVQYTEQEQRLTNTLRLTTEALKSVTEERDAQRKVLEQALEVIKYIGYVPRADGSHPVEKAITAIQEVLK